MAKRTIPCTNPECQSGLVQRSATCSTCHGDGEILNRETGKVQECPNPRCFWGSVSHTANCPVCGGKGELEV